VTATAYVESRILKKVRRGLEPSPILVTQDILDQFKREMGRNPKAGNWTSGKHFVQVFIPHPGGIGTMICHVVVKEWMEKLKADEEARLKIA
jgi:hypothetical protein